jgi:uncharacterized DUF497 family protein
MMGTFDTVTGFAWDSGNLDKNWEKYEVTNAECEEIFFNSPLLLRSDPAHSQTEPRNNAFGRTEAGRPLFVVYIIKANRIRVISARDMTERELEAYRDRLKKAAKI